MGAVTTKSGQKLLAALVCHEIDARAQRIPHCTQNQHIWTRRGNILVSLFLSEIEERDLLVLPHTQMQVETCIQAERTTVPHNVCHRLESTLILISSRDFVALGMRTVLSIGQQNRHLRAQFRELKRACEESVCGPTCHRNRRALTCDQCDTRTSRCTRRTKTGDRCQAWVGPLLVDMTDHVEAEIPLQPIRVDVFGSLVDREGNGSDKGDACQRSSYA